VKVGICFPMTMDGKQQADLFVRWCEAVDDSSLSTIALGDRIAYHSQDPLVSLSVAAGATRRAGLMTSVVALPTRNTGLIAKEVASLDVLSGGRFTFGVGISSRPEDYAVLDVPWENRLRRFEGQIADLRRIWRGESLREGLAPIGPTPITPGGPAILYGALTEPALRRAGRIADGIMTWSFIPDASAQAANLSIVQEEWTRQQRPGRPYMAAAMYFALGPDAEQKLNAYLSAYYAYSDSAPSRAMQAPAHGEARIEQAIRSYAEAGVDELLLSAADPSVAEVQRLSELVSRLGFEA
jgi:alkanesulfonate monooxygenase SsuD/methylene tetrahydromethanopterin reductase-like flavin-dependent oxidoreductase (luciferase family)